MDVRDIPKPVETVKPVFALGPALVLKVLGCAVVTTLGLHYLSQGKKNQDVEKMVLGAVLVLAGLFLFF